MNSRVLIAVCVAGWLTAASGCGDSGWAPLYQDGGRQDGNTVADAIEAGNLQPCTTIGEPCNAHDTCAIQPICDDNYLCRPASFQNCDDGLACTDDSCLGLGKCENKPQPGFCVLPVTVNGQTETKCFQAGDTSPDRPCSKCDPSVDPTNWTTSFDAVACDDGNACTKNDSCQAGVCKGEDFSATCSDGLSCTDDGCDGAGGCGPKTIMPGTCLIAGACYKAGDTTPDKCQVCDPSKTNTDWTTPSTVCQIDGVCYKQGEKNVVGGGCGECDPLASTSAWTVKGNDCLIAGTCFKSGDKAAGGGCLSCDPTKSKSDWTPDPNSCSIDGTCYASGAKHPLACAECDPTVSQASWTVKGSFCLINDFCYLPGVKDATGCAECQPSASKTGWTVASNMCQIDGVCYASGAAGPTSCTACTPSLSNTQWSVTANHCAIGGACYTAGTQDTTTTCRACDPSKDPKGWTPIANKCFIDNQCYNTGDKHPLVCGECDPTASNSSWTVKGSFCLIDDLCYLPGVNRPAGCGSCDPATDRYNWTPPTGKCLIGGSCYATGDKDGGCGVCDPVKSTSAWSQIAGCVIVSKPFALGAGGTSTDYGYGVAKDAAGNVYVAGTFYSSATFDTTTVTSKGGYDIFVAKLDPNGKVVWVSTAGGTSSDYAHSVSVDPAGNVYVAGRFSTTATFGTKTVTSVGSTDVFVAKLSPSGQFQWVTAGGSTSSDLAYKIATDVAGNSYVAGYFYSSATFGSKTLTARGSADIFVLKLDAQGQVVWAASGGSTSYDYGYGVAVDGAGNAYVTGSISTTSTFGTLTVSGSSDIVVAKLSPTGSWTWAKSAGGSSSNAGRGVAVDRSGNVFVTGSFAGTATVGTTTLTSKGSSDLFVTKLSPQGAFLWAVSAGSTSSDIGYAIGVDGQGNPYIGGYYRYSVAFGSTTLTSLSSSYDVFAAKLSTTDGKFIWATSGGGISSDYGYDIAVAPNGHVALTGYFSSSGATFGGVALTSKGGNDVFVWNVTQP